MGTVNCSHVENDAVSRLKQGGKFRLIQLIRPLTEHFPCNKDFY